MIPILKPLVVAVAAAAFTLRPYQVELEQEVNKQWATPGVENVLAVLPTGGGKTVTFSHIVHEHRAPACVIAHRQELVGQIALALARDGISHKIIAPKEVIKLCVKQQMKELGRSFYNPNSPVAVAGVDTLVRRKDVSAWASSVTLWVQDEAHHVLQDNKWGQAVKMFPNAKGLGVTATPTRADGKGLGRFASGVFDVLVEGPGMRELINTGYLTDYRVVAPPSDFDRDAIKVGSGGEFVKKDVTRALAKAQITGDIVQHYLKFAPGKLGVTFTTDVASAHSIADAFNRAGVPAAAVSGETPTTLRDQILDDFKKRKILQLVNCDLFGEGFDLPAIEVVVMGRPTQSYSLYVQQFGRALRLMVDPKYRSEWDDYAAEQRLAIIAASGKPCALIIDHVGNVRHHGLPDRTRDWTLCDRERSSKRDSDEIPTTRCTNPECYAVYERVLPACPYCRKKLVRGGPRATPKHVDGDLQELPPEVLAALRGEVEEADLSICEYRQQLIDKRCPNQGIRANVKKHAKRQDMQKGLRVALQHWLGFHKMKDRAPSEAQKRFYFKFGVDVLSAQALGAADALMLADRVSHDLAKLIIDEAATKR